MKFKVCSAFLATTDFDFFFFFIFLATVVMKDEGLFQYSLQLLKLEVLFSFLATN